MNFINTSLFKPSLLLMMSLGLFACGNDKPAESTTAQPTQETNTSTNTNTESGSTTTNSNNNNADVLTVAITPDFAPFTFADEKGALTGFDVDVLNAIAKNKGLNLQYKPTNFNNLFAEIESGSSDIAASAIFYKEERASKYGLTKPYHTDKPVFFYRADNKKLADATLTSVSDLNNYTLEIANVGTIEGLSDKHTIHSVKSEFLGFTGVLQNKYDISFSDGSILNHTIKNNPDSQKIPLKIVPYQENIGYVMVVNKDKTELLDKLNAGIDELTQSGELQKLREKYQLEQ